MRNTLRIFRIIVSLLLFVAAVLFAASGGTFLGVELGWIEKIQMIPMVLSVSVTTLILWFAVTFIFGRIYCSSVCPLGTLQDFFLRIPRLTRSQRLRRPFRYVRGLSTMRFSTLVVVIGSLLAGITVPACVLDPFAIFCKFVEPLTLKLLGTSAIAFIVTMATVVMIAVMAARRGRLWCNSLCPVGSALGVVSAHSVFHFDIDTDLCTNCRKCEYVCKTQCIDLSDHVVDGSRCVNCFDCLSVCEPGAIDYTTRRHTLSTPMMQRLRGIKRKPETALDSGLGGVSETNKKNKIDIRG